MILWPRLPLTRAKAISRDFDGQKLDALELQDWRLQEFRRFAPTGGFPVDNPTLEKLRTRLHDAAFTAGYPKEGGRAAASRFDSALQRVLLEENLPYGEGIRAEMWAWIAVILVPHLVMWRWESNGNVNSERYAGPIVRNGIGRLWYQAIQLDSGAPSSDERLKLLAALNADQMAALFERPSLAANREICKAVAVVWDELPAIFRDELLFREWMKALIVRGAVQKLDALRQESLRKVVRNEFVITASRLNAPIA